MVREEECLNGSREETEAFVFSFNVSRIILKNRLESVVDNERALLRQQLHILEVHLELKQSCQ